MIDADKARAILNEIAADEWGRPILDHLAAQWALARIEQLEAMILSQSRSITKLLEKAAKKRSKKK